MPKVIWVLVNSNSRGEAGRLGRALLRARLCACYSLYRKQGSFYWWPPHQGRVESSRGPLLVLETLPRYYRSIVKRLRQLHSDKVPFIGRLDLADVNPDFYRWLRGELAGR